METRQTICDRCGLPILDHDDALIVEDATYPAITYTIHLTGECGPAPAGVGPPFQEPPGRRGAAAARTRPDGSAAESPQKTEMTKT